MAKKNDSPLDVSDGDSGMIDFSGVEEPSFAVLPKGNYNVIITDCDADYSQAGNKMWTMQMTVTDGEYVDRKLFFHVTFSEKAMPFARKTLAQIAPDLLESKWQYDDPEIVGRFVNMECIAQVKIKKYEGENRNNVGALLAAESAFS